MTSRDSVVLRYPSMINKTIYLLLFLSLSLSSCFEIVEEININEDGSGKFVLSVNLSQSKSKLESILLMDSINNYKVPSIEDMNQKMDEWVAHANTLSGLNNVKTTRDFNNFIFSFECQFKEVSVLNELSASLERLIRRDSLNTKEVMHFQYDKLNKTFTRTENSIIRKKMSTIRPQEEEILSEANFFSILRFTTPISYYENKNAKISPTKKAILIKANALDLVKGKTSIANFIKLEK